MRSFNASNSQPRFDCVPISSLHLDVACRDEMIPLLRGLQYVYEQKELRERILGLIAADVNKERRDDCGREGFSYWQIFVLAVMRFGCNLNYDKLQYQAQSDANLRAMLQVNEWEPISFNWRRIRNNLCLLRQETVDQLISSVVGEGHQLCPEAPKKVRADSFVAETNIHHPTESSLMRDGCRKILKLCAIFAGMADISGWRQHEHLHRKVKRMSGWIDRIASKKGRRWRERIKTPYRVLITETRMILDRARVLQEALKETKHHKKLLDKQREDFERFLELTEQVCQTAERRVLKGETVPNREKVFSLFEAHTQLYKRGKAGEPVQYGRLVLVYEDAVGFVVHYHILDRESQDQDVLVEQTQIVQQRLNGAMQQISVDQGFHSPENQRKLPEIVTHPCLPMKGHNKQAMQNATASVQFKAARKRHPGVESAIGALQHGNGLKRCRDRTEEGFNRYVAYGILARNIQVLGKLLIRREHPASEAAYSLRKNAVG